MGGKEKSRCSPDMLSSVFWGVAVDVVAGWTRDRAVVQDTGAVVVTRWVPLPSSEPSVPLSPPSPLARACGAARVVRFAHAHRRPVDGRRPSFGSEERPRGNVIGGCDGWCNAFVDPAYVEFSSALTDRPTGPHVERTRASVPPNTFTACTPVVPRFLMCTATIPKGKPFFHPLFPSLPPCSSL